MSRTFTHAVLACLVLGAAPACDRCFGTTACAEGRIVSYAAEVVLGPDREVGAGILIELVGRSGFATEDVRASARTDARGRAIFTVPGATAAHARVDLLFHLPEPFNTVYRARDVVIETTSVENDIRFQDWWFDTPFIRHAARLWYQPSQTRHAEGVEVTFTRTGGIELSSDVLHSTTNRSGDFLLVSEAASGGTVVGDLLLTPPPPYEPRLLQDVELTAVLARDEVAVFGNFSLGRVIQYGGIVYADDGTTPVEGATVVFERTGGLEISPARHESPTGTNGAFRIEVVPVGDRAGTVIGRLEILPPSPYLPITVDSLALETLDDADGKAGDLGSWTLERGS
ncbi:MAG: hypothetical protein ACRELV_02125 [Longimicrobiales bacterium]